MAIYTSVEEGVADLVPLSNKMARSPWYLKKEEMEALKKWLDSIVKEKGKRTTFIYNRKYIDFMCENWGFLGGNWYKGTNAGAYNTDMINHRNAWLFSRFNRPEEMLKSLGKEIFLRS